MNTSTFLTPQEIVDLTNRVLPSAQARVLNAMGIEHKVRPDGTVAILRKHIDKVFDGLPDDITNKADIPDWASA